MRFRGAIVVRMALLLACAGGRPALGQAQVRSKATLTVQAGHTGPVVAAVFSPDGKYVATASMDKTARLWNAVTGEEIRVFRYHVATVRSVAFSPDGKILATASLDHAVALWDVATGTRLRSLRHSDSVNAVAFAPDGRTLATGGWDKTARLWNTATGEEIRVLTGHKEQVTSLAFSPNGQFLATGSQDATARLWNAATGEQVRVFGPHEDSQYTSIDSVAFNPDGTLLVTAAQRDQIARIWNVSTGEAVRAFKCRQPGNYLMSVAFSPDGKSLATAGEDVILWNVAKGSKLRTIERQRNPMTFVSFSPDGRFLATANGNGLFGDPAAYLWSTDTGEKIRDFKGHASMVGSSAFSPDGKYVATGGDDQTVRVWDLGAGVESRVIHHTGPLKTFTLISGGLARTPVAFSPDGKFVIGASWEEVVHRWNAATGALVDDLKGHTDDVTSMAFSPDGRVLATSGSDELILWDAVTGKKRLVRKGMGEPLAYSPDGELIATVCRKDTACVWNARTGEEIRAFTGHKANVKSLAFSPDGKILATAGRDATARLWNAATGEELHVLKGHRGSLLSIAFSPDGRFVATAGEDTTARLWNAATGEAVRDFEGHGDTVGSVGFSPDGRFLMTSSGDGTTRFWSLRSGKELCALISLDKGWVVVSPDGYFDGSAEGMKNIRWTVGLESFPLEAFSEGYYAPGLLAKVLSGESLGAVRMPKLSDGFALPPLVKITSPQAGTALESGSLDVNVEAADKGGGVDEIRLYQNGKAVGSETRGMKAVLKDGSRAQSFHVTLVDGENVFKAVALSRDRIEGNPDEVKVAFAGAQKQAVLHVVAVGINEYKNSSLNLNYAQPDAKALADFFASAPRRLFKETRTHELFNASATKAAILAQLAELKSAPPQDVVMIYLAGHGDTIDNTWYFIPYDLVYPEREEAIKSQGLSSKEIQDAVKEIGAQKVLLLLDACKSGEALQAFASRGVEDRKALSQLARAAGVHVVAASTKDQFASEVKELGHGVFTYTLLQGLGGKAAGAGDRVVTVRGLLTYVENELPEISQKYKAQAQYPVVDSRGMDFPITAER